MEPSPLRIAIIGGGISGLSMAYYLQKLGGRARRELQVSLFERKAALGGNAETVLVNLGQLRWPGEKPEEYVRWADLGVNDVNLSAYRRLKAAMEEIGYLEHMKPLQNTESYFSRDGRFVLTDDAELYRGVSDPSHSLEHADGGRLAPLVEVVHRTALDLVDGGRLTPRYTVSDFFDSCVADPRGMLEAAADRLHVDIDWQDPDLPQRLETVRHRIYYPRISARYFADDRGPAGMPLQAPFEYYKVQEGGDQPPDRRYFEHGAQCWLEALADHVTGAMHPAPGVRVHRQAPVGVRVEPDRVRLSDLAEGGAAEPRDFDLAILATHADDALDILTFGDGLGETWQRLRRILGGVRYTRSYSVCHTDSERLPPDTNAWRTYNIEVRDPQDSFFPYRIDYVVNRHQNDMRHPAYDRAGLPQFFVSLVDDLNRIPRCEMLDRCRASSLEALRVPADELPAAVHRQLDTGRGDSGYKEELEGLDDDLHRKAWTYFKHNVLDADCIAAQAEIDRFNVEAAQAWRSARPGPRVLFAGGWTRGAGLQEQCMAQSERLGRLLLADDEPA